MYAHDKISYTHSNKTPQEAGGGGGNGGARASGEQDRVRVTHLIFNVCYMTPPPTKVKGVAIGTVKGKQETRRDLVSPNIQTSGTIWSY